MKLSRSALLALQLVWVASISGQVVTESFTGSTAPGWVLGGNGYTPTLTSGGLDPVNDGWLRLTDNANNRATYAYYDTAVSSANRTIFTSFDFAHYNGSGADGMTFFLFDGAAEFSVGAFGGSMGYAQKTLAGGGEVNKEGLAGGYLAISLDDFGNFSNGTEGRVSGIGQNPNSIAVRGPGSGFDGYEFIAATGDGINAALTQQLDFPGMTSRPDQTGADYRHIEILITPTNQLSVWLQFGAAGSLQKVMDVDLSGYLRPETLKFGFTSGTGGLNEIHEMRALTVATLVANLWDNNGSGGATGAWATADNWDPNFLPALNADILFDNTHVGVAQTIDVGTGATRDVRSIQIDAPFSYTLNNGTLRFDDGGLPGFVGINLTQTNGVAAGGHTINSALNLDTATSILNNTTSALALSGAIDTDSFALSFGGSGNTTASGIISGAGSITKSDAGTLTLNGANTYAGGTTLNDGNLVVGHNTALGTGGVTLAGGNLSSTGSRTIANTLTLTGNAGLSAITTTGTLTQSGGNRTLSLDAATLNGALNLSNNNTGRTLTLNVSGDSAIGGVIANGGTGAGGIVKTGDGTLTLGGANTYTGTTNISEGVLQLGASNRIADGSSVIIGASGTLNLAGFSERVDNLTAAGGGATIDFGATSGANTFLFDTYTAPSSGVLVINNWESSLDNLATTVNSQTVGSIYFSGFGVAAYDGTATLYGASRYLLRPVLATEKEWDGSSSSTWSTNNNWTSSGEPDTAQIALFDDLGLGRLTANLNDSDTIAGIRFGTGATSSYNLTSSANRTLTLAGAVPYIQQQSGSNQTIAIDRLQLNANTVADITGSGDLIINSSIRQDGSNRALIKDGTGAGKLILGGTTDNTYAGGLFINNGIVEARKTTALGSGAATIASGAALELSGGISPTNAITLGGSGVGGNGAIRNLSGNNTLSGNLTLAADTRFQSDAGTLTLSGAALDDTGRNLSFGGAGNVTVSKAITTGAGTLTKDGTGTLTLSGTTANTTTGVTNVNTGTLDLNKTAGINAISGNLVIGDGTGTDTVRILANNQISDSATVTINNGGVLNLNGAGRTETIAGLNASSTGAQVQLGTGTLTVDNAGSNSYAGSFTGSGSFNVAGVGRMTLSGTSGGFTGTTNVNEGIVAVQSGTALGTSTVNVASGANLEIQGGITVANNLTLRGNGTGAVDGAVENFSGNNTLSGAISLAENARIQSSAGNLTVTGNITATDRNLTVGGSGNTNLNGTVGTGTGSLTKEGSGTLILNGAATYTGDTLINGGTLRLGASNRIADASDVVVAAGALFSLNGFSESVQSLAGAGTVDFGGGALTLGTGLGSPLATTFSGTLAGVGSLKLADANYTLNLGAAVSNTSLGIELGGGRLGLGGFTHAFNTLTVSGNSILDFGGSSAATFNSISFTGDYTLTVQNWTDTVDYFYSLLAPNSVDLSRIVFTGFTGDDTKYQSYDLQVTPVPEPSTYGAIFIGLSGAFVWWRRRSSAKR